MTGEVESAVATITISRRPPSLSLPRPSLPHSIPIGRPPKEALCLLRPQHHPLPAHPLLLSLALSRPTLPPSLPPPDHSPHHLPRPHRILTTALCPRPTRPPLPPHHLLPTCPATRPRSWPIMSPSSGSEGMARPLQRRYNLIEERGVGRPQPSLKTCFGL